MQIYSNYQDEGSDEKYLTQSSVLRIQNLELALERAIEDISLLQKNLSFVIQIKEELETELKVRDKREEMLLKEFQKELHRKDSQISYLKNDQGDITDLLTDTKETLNAKQLALMQHQQERKRYMRIIQDQRSTIQVLEEQLLASKYASDLSNQSISFDNGKTQQIQRQNESLRFELHKLKNQFDKQYSKFKKSEKQVQTFKSWLGSVLGVRKVIDGCQTMLMQQIRNRLANCPKY